MDPNFPLTYWLLGRAYLAKGMYREALAEHEKYLALSRGSPGALALAHLGNARGLAGERSQALQVLGEFRELSKEKYVSPDYFALVYVGLGEKDQAFAWLEKAYQERASRVVFLKVEAEWDPLRSDPRFRDLLRRMGLPP